MKKLMLVLVLSVIANSAYAFGGGHGGGHGHSSGHASSAHTIPHFTPAIVNHNSGNTGSTPTESKEMSTAGKFILGGILVLFSLAFINI